MSKGWLKEILEKNRKDVELWPEWKRAGDPSRSELKQAAKNSSESESKTSQSKKEK